MREAHKRPCPREGCPRRVKNGRAYCSELCSRVDRELATAQRICQATGDTELWAAAVGLSDALSEFLHNSTRVWLAALDVGITADQFDAIRRGATV